MQQGTGSPDNHSANKGGGMKNVPRTPVHACLLRPAGSAAYSHGWFLVRGICPFLAWICAALEHSCPPAAAIQRMTAPPLAPISPCLICTAWPSHSPVESPIPLRGVSFHKQKRSKQFSTLLLLARSSLYFSAWGSDPGFPGQWTFIYSPSQNLTQAPSSKSHWRFPFPLPVPVPQLPHLCAFVPEQGSASFAPVLQCSPAAAETLTVKPPLQTGSNAMQERSSERLTKYTPTCLSCILRTGILQPTLALRSVLVGKRLNKGTSAAPAQKKQRGIFLKRIHGTKTPKTVNCKGNWWLFALCVLQLLFWS